MVCVVPQPLSRPIPASIDEQDRVLESIYRSHAVPLRGHVLRLTRDPATADDIVGETFLRLAIEFRAGRAPDSGPAWLNRVARNLAVSRARRTNVAARALSRLVDRAVAQSPETEVIGRERDVRVRDALATLANDDRRIVVLAARGYQPAEIALIVEKPGSATRTRLCRARGHLRACLEPADMTA